jgi:hypothetical protein
MYQFSQQQIESDSDSFHLGRVRQWHPPSGTGVCCWTLHGRVVASRLIKQNSPARRIVDAYNPRNCTKRMIILRGTTVGFKHECGWVTHYSGERDRAPSLPCFQMFYLKFLVLRPTTLSSAVRSHDLTTPHILQLWLEINKCLNN